MRVLPVLLFLSFILSGCHQPSQAGGTAPQQKPPLELQNVEGGTTAQRARSRGQVVYIPCYSHIKLANGQDYRLAVNLSIRNTSQSESLQISSVEYYDTDGVLKKNYAEQALTLKPLATAEFFIGESDMTGGSGANFIVTWNAEKAISEPIMEAVMVGTGGSQGVSFMSSGRLLKESSANR